MKITRENYEAYFIDYLDGAIEEDQVDEFIEFLQKNQDLKEELLAFKKVKLHPGKAIFENKNKLYREELDSEQVFAGSAIAFLEGEMSPEEKKAFLEYLEQKPEKERDFRLFEKTILTPQHVSYPNRSRLYKTTSLRKLFIWSARAAAILVFAVILTVILQPSEEETAPGAGPVAETLKEPYQKTIEVLPADKTIFKEPVIQKKTRTLFPGDMNSSPAKKLQETTPVLTGETDPGGMREYLPVPPRVASLNAELKSGADYLTLAVHSEQENIVIQASADEERLLANIVREEFSKRGISFRILTRSGLNLATKLTDDKFSYNTGPQDEIVRFTYNSRLLGFSIPTPKK